MNNWLYSDIVKDHFTNPRNVLFGDESEFPADAKGQTGNIRCGDQMLMLLQIKDDVINDVRWKTYGCASAIASTSVLSEMIKGMNIKDAYAIGSEDLVKKLGGLPEHKIHCSVLGDKALRVAIDDYLEHTGRAGMLKEASTEICHCLGITDKDIEKAFNNGARTWEQLQEATKIGTVCGGCKEKALELLHEYMHIYG
ncbi:iron-sulfur cluster assembly scaffold protein [Spirochaetia bacterium]|nr:iron-sulfur cluster assembly scaffold protein [Spirochaetia bacterium]GHU35302.1 iron-sulfur cluster assembly scaffold protein [Spirochaetia bacterium]